jgi:hypothetical protein
MTFLFNKMMQVNLFDDSSKTCYCCKKVKLKLDFHKHQQMKDGRLNICKACCVQANQKRRAQNPNSRKEERERARVRFGRMTRQEYFEKLRANSKGRDISINKYAHKRRLQTDRTKITELDEFAFEEAIRLKKLRKSTTKIEWHLDHIVPLNHKTTCGLHNAFNFQVVPAKWNMAKKNSNMNKYFAGV